MITIIIDGEPTSQGRGRAVAFKRGDGSIGARVYDPAKARGWKQRAAKTMAAQMHGRMPFTGPVWIEITAWFACPKSQHRKRVPTPARPHTSRPDWDNCAKAICDSAKGILWNDDAQIADARVRKMVTKQGAEPCVVLHVGEISAQAQMEAK